MSNIRSTNEVLSTLSVSTSPPARYLFQTAILLISDSKPMSDMLQLVVSFIWRDRRQAEACRTFDRQNEVYRHCLNTSPPAASLRMGLAFCPTASQPRS